MKLTDETIEEIWNKADCSRNDEAYLRDDVFDLINDLNDAKEEVNKLQQEVTMWNEAAETQKNNNLVLATEPIKLKEENEWLKRILLAAEGYGSWDTLSKQTVDDIVQNMKNADTLHEEEFKWQSTDTTNQTIVNEEHLQTEK